MNGRDVGRMRDSRQSQEKRRCYGNDALTDGTSRDTPHQSPGSFWSFPALLVCVGRVEGCPLSQISKNKNNTYMQYNFLCFWKNVVHLLDIQYSMFFILFNQDWLILNIFFMENIVTDFGHHRLAGLCCGCV